MVAHPERRHGASQLTLPIRTQRRPISLQAIRIVSDHLTLFTTRAGHKGHPEAAIRGQREQPTRGQSLVVGVRVHRHDWSDKIKLANLHCPILPSHQARQALKIPV
jgi:hypothetical protein